MSHMPEESIVYFRSISEALSFWVPTECIRKWSAVLSDGVLHANSRCEEVGGEESWNLKKTDLLTSITLEEMVNAPNHCLACVRSYMEGGFIYNWFGKSYKSVLNINNTFVAGDKLELMYEFYSFSYSDTLGVKEECVMYEKLKDLGILTPNFSKPLSYLYVKKQEIPKNYPIDHSGNHSFKNGFYLHPIFSIDKIPYGIALPTPVSALSKVLEVFTVLLSEREAMYGYEGIKELWNVSDKV